ncbi:hypothetical protein KAR91_08765 [Candidatus Pacearchaeota archaeon]|nr:hypothetical protein [Candidatus Pacearchaeota archaeon]
MAKKNKPRSLENITLDEVSLVDRAANKRKFLFFKAEDGNVTIPLEKADLKVEIESDGTAEGTKVTINGKDLGELTGFSFDFWSPEGTDSKGNLSCSYTKVVEDEDGFKRTETFRLNKGETKLNETIAKLLKAYYGNDKDIIVDVTKDSEGEIAKALELINKSYRGDFPDDLGDAVGVLASYAGMGCSTTLTKSSEIDVLKKDLEELRTLITKKQKTEKKDDTSDDTKDNNQIAAVTKAVEAIVEKMNKKEDKKEKKSEETSVLELLKSISDRLETVEKSSNGRQSLEETDENDDETDVKKSSGKWPSLLEAASK